jgi:hypothetical protein
MDAAIDFNGPWGLTRCGAFSNCGPIHEFSYDGHPGANARMSAIVTRTPDTGLALPIDQRIDPDAF